MRRSSTVAAIILILLTVLSGCALTDDTLKLRCNTTPTQGTKFQSIPDISVAKWTDARKVDDPKFVYFKNNNMGKTNGRLSSQDSTVADFTTEVVKKSLEQIGIKVVDNSQFVLSGRILSLDSSARIGFWTVAVDSIMHGEVQLTKRGQLVSKTSFVDKGSAEDLQVVVVADYEDSLEKLFANLSNTVIDFVKSSSEQK